MTALAFVLAVNATQQPASLPDLFAKKDYFALRDALPLQSKPDASFYRGVVANKFNRLDEAVRELNVYLALPRTEPRFVEEARSLLCDSLHKSFEYRKAADAYRELLPLITDREDRKDTENSLRLWSAVQDVPKQTVRVEGDTDVPLKESIGLRVPIEVGGETYSFIFDTGANISLVSMSYAQKMGMKVFDTQIDVGGISGTTVKSRLAHLKEMRLGKAVIRDAVFLVMDDKDLNIQGFQLNAILGYPVISALREVTLTKNGRLLVLAKPQSAGDQNLAMEGLTLLAQVLYRGKKVVFALDTGANTTLFYPPLFKEWSTEITREGTLESEWVTGVGTRREISSYRLKDVTLELARRKGTLKQVPVLLEKTNEKSLHFYGNLGQDYLGQFPSVTFNFERMSVTFG